jgi:molybdopterin converting factor subunit 1
MVRVKFFGWAKDLCGTAVWECNVEGTVTVDEMWNLICSSFPVLTPHRNSFALAVNREYALADTSVPSNAEVAVIPPVSGG